jgi:probable phosphoglycerate mutase
MLECWMVRHGETIENRTRVIAGQNASPLTEHGQEQAKLLGKRLQHVGFDAIYISDLNRTKQTADAIIRAMGPDHRVKAFTDRRLREKKCGEGYEGQPIGYIEQMRKLSGQSHRVFRPAAGESWEDVSKRAHSFLLEILSRYCTSPEHKRILIITHGGFISEFLSLAVGGVPNHAKNCSVFVLECSQDHSETPQFCLKISNDVSHVRSFSSVSLPRPCRLECHYSYFRHSHATCTHVYSFFNPLFIREKKTPH